MTEPDIPALFVFNALYGGCVTSKLFLNVREKLSLCYYVGSRLSTHKGLLTVTSGIDVKTTSARSPRSRRSSTPCAPATLRTASCAPPSAAWPATCAPRPTRPTRWRGTGSTARCRGWTSTRPRWPRSWKRSRART
ncbi:MAG: insulinase family protein [Oscillospiraceae bacterium]